MSILLCFALDKESSEPRIEVCGQVLFVVQSIYFVDYVLCEVQVTNIQGVANKGVYLMVSSKSRYINQTEKDYTFFPLVFLFVYVMKIVHGEDITYRII